MNKYYCTLGTGYPERVQPIIASSQQKARQIMFAKFGHNWAFDYTEEQYQQALDDGFFKNAKYLPLVREKVTSDANT